MRPFIFFDWDGTLADSSSLCVAHMIATYEELGLGTFDPAWEKFCCGPTYLEAAALLGIPPERREEYCRVRRKQEALCVKDHSRLFPGIREMLEELHHEAELVIVSNGYPDYIAACLANAGVTHLFRHAEALIEGRTKTQALAQVLERFKPEKAIMVGDRIGDIRAGKDNGLPTIAAAFGYGNDVEFAEATQRADTMEELQALLLRFAKE